MNAKDKCERPMEELETTPIEPVAPTPASEQSQAAVSDWQTKVGNSSIVLAAAAGSPLDPAKNLSCQLSLGNAAVSRTLLQRKPAGDLGAPAETAPVVEPTVPGSAVASELIVEDTSPGVMPAQMKKSQFLAELRTAVSSTASDSLAGTVWASQVGPRIDSALAQFGSQSSRQVEQSIRRYAPEAAGVATARGFIPIIAARVRRSATTWVTTGQISGLPQGIPLPTPGAGVMGAIGSAVSGLAGATMNVISGAGDALSGIGNMLFKERTGGARDSGDPEAIRAQLGAGQSLDGRVRSRMESAFGENFSDVAVHADSNAAGLSENLNARAFTVGPHIAFGAGEYKPGTLIGDALIAHELAHVTQQRNGAAEGPAQKGASEYGTLEEDADEAAVGAVVSSWGLGKAGLVNLGRKTLPKLKSGLRLQRCDVCTSRPAPIRIVRFSDLQRLWPTLTTATDREAALASAIASARPRATQLFNNFDSDPILGIRTRITTTTGTRLELNPLTGVTQDNVEQAYRSWAEGAGVEPWVLLANTRKEGLSLTVSDTWTATTADRAKSLYRSATYYRRLGADHYISYEARSGDNEASFTDADAPAHEGAFRAAVAAQFAAGRLPRDLSDEINAELTATPAGAGEFQVAASNRFFSLSMMLVGAFYRENQAAVATDPRIGPNPDPGLVYMRWNMGAGRFANFMTSAEGHRAEPGNALPDGGTPSVAQWAFERRVRNPEFGQPRRNAIRFRYFIEVFRLIYEGW